MDGFYVAKFKVEKRTTNASTSATASASSSKTKANGSSASTFAAANAADDVDMDTDTGMGVGVNFNDASRAMKLSDKGELVPDKEARKAAKEGKFDDAADEEIMKSESTSTCCGCDHTYCAGSLGPAKSCKPGLVLHPSGAVEDSLEPAWDRRTQADSTDGLALAKEAKSKGVKTGKGRAVEKMRPQSTKTEGKPKARKA